MIQRYLLHGVPIASDIALPDLPADPADQKSQVLVRSGAVPARLHGTLVRHGRFQWNGQQLLLSVPGTARFLVTAGTEIRVDVAPGADGESVAVFLLGSVWAACCHLRNLLLLHASAARVGTACVAFIGGSGSGKSTLAALLAARRHSIVADDTCLLASNADGTRIHPAQPRLKLWRDALSTLPAAATAQPAPGQPGKFKIPMTEHWQHQPLPVDCILLLHDDRDGSTPGLARLPPLDSVQAITSNTFRPNLVRLLGRQPQNFALSAAVAATTEVHRWVRPWGVHRQGEMIEMLERWLQQRATQQMQVGVAARASPS